MAVCLDPPLGYTFGGVDAPGTDFNVDSTNCGDSLTPPNPMTSVACTATIAFKPSAAGARSGVLQTNDGQAVVVLNGVGQDPDAKGNGSGSGGKKCKKKKKKKGKRSASAAKKKKGCKKRKKKD
jgi:hypothetical protein